MIDMSARISVGVTAGILVGLSLPLRLAKGDVIPSWLAAVGTLTSNPLFLDAEYLAISMDLPPPIPRYIVIPCSPVSAATFSATDIWGDSTIHVPTFKPEALRRSSILRDIFSYTWGPVIKAMRSSVETSISSR